jgi:hypothetical protein
MIRLKGEYEHGCAALGTLPWESPSFGELGQNGEKIRQLQEENRASEEQLAAASKKAAEAEEVIAGWRAPRAGRGREGKNDGRYPGAQAEINSLEKDRRPSWA